MPSEVLTPRETEHPRSGRGIAILDPGAQYGQVIDRRVRNLNVNTTYFPLNTRAEDLVGFDGIIISGGPKSVNDVDAPQCDPDIFNLNIPMLGICYGMQLMAKYEGGRVGKRKKRQDGPCQIKVKTDSSLFANLEKRQEVLMSHGDSVIKLPKGFSKTAVSDGLTAAMENPDKKMYAVQFHPEVDITEHGKEMLSNFLFDIAKCEPNFTMEDRKERAIREIRERVGDKKVMAFVSGGVDSTVMATLLHEALGKDKVRAVHVDNGFMRKDESAKVKEALAKIGVDLEIIDATDRFLHALEGVIDPEQKRQIIGDEFFHIAQECIAEMGGEDEVFLGQGTLRPDLIESASKLASGNADTIKTHHNDSPLVREMRDRNKLVEPFTDYHKDEVRELGEMLGLPSDIVWRQPFPGPGLGIRIIAAREPYYGKDSASVEKQLKKHRKRGINTSLLPIKTVGVQGDARTYSHLVGLSGKQDWKLLRKMAQQIPKDIHSVNRVAYIFGEPVKKPVKTVTHTEITEETVAQLRQADNIVTEVMEKYDLLRKLSQVPVILTPLDFDGDGKRSIAIRTFLTKDYMTGLPAIPGTEQMPEEALFEMVNRIMEEVHGISRVMYDLTSKPPGTTEWE